MKTRRRLAWLLLSLGVGLFLAVQFRAAVLVNFVIPVGELLLLLWRLVQSVHQALYWGLLILAAGGLALYRFTQSIESVEAAQSLTSESILKTISNWRTWILVTGPEGRASITLRRELAQMLVMLYAIKTPEATPYNIYEALKLHQIPLPARIYAFLLADEASAADRSWRRRLQRLADKPRKWIRQWTGREQAEYYQAIEETLTFLETQMEIKHGDDYFNPSDH
jgi:hypothetical protein